MSIDTKHGAFGSDGDNFIRMLPQQDSQLSKSLLAQLALAMESGPDSIDPGPDAEENMFVPAGYTYFGQFIDHDLTRDTTSTFDGINAPTNQRTPRFDLDCVYGKGPIDEPNIYEEDGATLKLGEIIDPATGRQDLFRNSSGTAQIGDPRNDENSIVSQIQAAMIRFHNSNVVKQKALGLSGAALFNTARNHTRWEYQKVIVEDYLKRIINASVIQKFDADRNPDAKGLSQNQSAFVLYKQENRAALPIEFAGAAYRFGHSMVRNGYFLQDNQSFPIFDGKMDQMSLVGFQPLPKEHVIQDWHRFFPDSSQESSASGNTFRPEPGVAAGKNGENSSPDDSPGNPRLQFGYRIDTSVVNPLASLPASVADDPPPSLLVRNLWRGAAFLLPSGQDFERALIASGKIQRGLDSKYLVVRQQLKQSAANGDKQFKFVSPPLEVLQATPLWFYILAESQRAMVDQFGTTVFTESDMKQLATVTGAQLGEVGGRILLEVFNGLLDSDPESYRNNSSNWTSELPRSRVWDIVTIEQDEQL